MNPKNNFARVLLLGTACATLTMGPGAAIGSPAAEDQVMDPHAGHRMMTKTGSRYVRTVSDYDIPDVTVVDQDGSPVRFRELVASDEPLVVNFIFTSCTTICPVLSATFSQAQDDLVASARPPRLISITIDPDYDTPAQLRRYADQFHAGANWTFITGASADILAIQRSFDAYRGDKLNHIPLTFLRQSRDTPWVRLEGFTSSGELVSEYGVLISAATD
jgi:protein SCO1/2